MSRTYRNKSLAKNIWRFKHSQLAPVAMGQKALWTDTDYKPRTRDYCLNYPHYLNAWEDQGPSALKDKYSYV